MDLVKMKRAESPVTAVDCGTVIHKTHNLKLASNDKTLHLTSAGIGRDIVLIHGALTTHTDWMGLLFDGVAARGRAIAVDRPGHGRSLRPRFQSSPLEQARQLREGLRQLGLKRPLLIGHSFGALVAAAWASAYPDEVSGVMLLAPILFQEYRLEHISTLRALPAAGPVLAQASLMMDAEMIPLAQNAMFAPHPPPADWLARYPYDRILSSRAMVAEAEDAAAVLPGTWAGLINYPAIEAPIRIVIGERDRVVHHTRHARRLAWIKPTAQLTARLDAGHMVHHTAPDTFFTVLDELLATTADRR